MLGACCTVVEREKEIKAMRTITGESCLFQASDKAALLYKPKKILRVFQPLTGQVFVEGVDYTWTEGVAEIKRLEGSALPMLTEAEVHPDPATAKVFPKNQENPNAIGTPTGLVWFGINTACMQKQFEVDYTTEEEQIPVVLSKQLDRLPRFRAKLAAKKPLLITVIGDSISEGWNATKHVKSQPFTPCYVEQFGIGLQAISGATVTVQNNAIGGTGIHHPMQIPERWRDIKSDLLVIAYGMNNYSSLPADEFIKLLDEVVRTKRAAGTDTDILLVSTMSGNEEYNGPKHREYGEALRKYVATAPNDVALADVHLLWQEIVKRKGFLALTGNGVNHPNDYGHRIYASVLLSLFQ